MKRLPAVSMLLIVTLTMLVVPTSSLAVTNKLILQIEGMT